MKKILTTIFILAFVLFTGCLDIFNIGDDNGDIKFQKISELDSVNSVYFIDNNSGWAYGDSVIYKTDDGGESWTQENSTIKNIIKLKFVDNSVGWLLTSNSIYRTTDGGESWNLKKSDIKSNMFNDLFVIDKDFCSFSISKNSSMMTTENGGENWRTDSLSGVGVGIIIDIQFFDKNEGYVLCVGGQFFHTQNNGQNWDEIEIDVPFITCIFYLNSEEWFAGNTNMPSSLSTFETSIFNTKNKGRNWTEIDILKTSMINKILFIDRNIGYAHCGSFLMKTSNNGLEWEKVDLGEYYPKDMTIAGDKLIILTDDNTILKGK